MAEEIINIQIIEEIENITISIQEPSKTSDLVNDGADGIHPFITLEDVIIDLDGLVPYTGATSDVDLGLNNLYTNKLYLFDEAEGESGSIHYADEALHFSNSDDETLLWIEPGFMQIHQTPTIQSNLFTTSLSENRDHYLPNKSGTLAVTSDITGINSGTNTGDETATTIKSKLGITTLSGSNTGDQDLSGLVVKNSPITGATKTKITYDNKGLVTSGADATTADIADSTNKRYVTDANLTTIGNQSGTNTGDETISTIKTKLGITTLSGSNTGDQDLSGLALKSMGAYSMRVNNTNATANAVETNFRSQALQVLPLGNITFVGTLAPSGGSQSYQWQQEGNKVTATFTGIYGTSGTLITQVNIALPSDMPTPIRPTGVTATAGNKCYIGTGSVSTSATSIPTTYQGCFLSVNSADTSKFDIILSSSGSARYFYATIIYFTA